MEKRGLSNIIVTLITITLVLVAVSIVWGVVSNIIQEGSEQIELGRFTLDLEIKSVKIEGDDVTVDVIVQRNPGPGEFIGMNFVFSDGQNSEVIREDTVLKELEERSFTYTLSKIITSELEDVSIAPIYELSSGKEETGNVADMFDVKKGGSIVTGGAVEELSNFEQVGLVGWGTADYQVSSGGVEKLPVIERIIVDPLDVAVGNIQTFIAYVTSPNEITEVTTRTQLDNEILILPLEKTENENEYMATWEVYDTHTTTYRTNFTARDSAGNENTVPMSWTDPCTSLADHGTAKVISSACTVGSGVDGLDNGNITLSTGGTITMNGGTFIRTPGYWMIFSGGSLITSGGEVREAYLYYNDVDGDLHGSGYNWSTSSTYTGNTRANLAIGSSDCLDTDADTYQQLNNLELDSDRDRYSNGGTGSACVGDKSSFWWMHQNGVSGWINTLDALGNTDCNTGDADVYQNVVNLILDADQDRYSIGSSATRCVGDKTSFWYKDADGTDKWISTTDDLGTDCTNENCTWGSGVLTDSICRVALAMGSQLSGSCSPPNSTNDYEITGSFCGGESFTIGQYTQTCQ